MIHAELTMRARPAHERYASLPWLLVTMTVTQAFRNAMSPRNPPTFSNSSVARLEKSHVWA